MVDISRRSFTVMTVFGPLIGRAALPEHDRVARARVSGPPIDGPDSLRIEWLPAPYQQYGTDPVKYGNHDVAHRPSTPSLTRIVIHDTEETYDNTIKLVEKPSYLAWNYTLRSSDGHVAQHLDPKDIGWHAGNWYYNMHALGLEHEGKALEGKTWYTDAMYRSSATLVRYLCDEYSIPMTRGHVIGHDEVPGTDTEHIKGMHWDPGPFWNWTRYFELLGSSLFKGTVSTRPKRGDVVRILPDFETNTQVFNGQVVTGVNFVTARQAPSPDAPTVVDAGIRPEPATTEPSDVGARLNTGAEYVVAEVGGQDGEWVAVWYLGAKAWFHNPATRPVARVVPGARTVTVVSRTSGYGRAFPEASAYPDPAWVQPDAALPYVLERGQRYVVIDPEPATDYYRSKTFDAPPPKDHVNVTGKDRYVCVFLGHRQGYLKAKDVQS
ncbi:N-acetylmuramoyl-L-alanine amidase [Propionibacterium sp. NM47_B9-13]|jgi:N-acetyl-anhydromuramyl-L-alanine amidase AmpD|uniref:N-acetylmuramoyl-L-alanine amidase n=2 Tax=Cutibacterium modestum TaxID=2559073 RepID=A0AAD1KQV3_9ACTN|nr:N-acetylmuramoyl-L-alanine amidase [Cutibacterium modestum]TGY29558.1 N-acetylmuramoyl-L-alanine amidase [Propionibacterium sp. NM47_B9-13]AOH44683.1 N-acetylmuramoyl-L-alanine amidase [Cutibacterium modestum]EFS75076.1 N-acetylmuramoyl-L-alanine amidase [Cutibacterium modestum HL037PA2]EFS91795.1 N-acetylmuramoyl-L-alanine amidase [Cutibacterium modestum HL044PA1]EFT15844.1 N-acetylmuramoyl-L-alanine amidase [Cutibacterium modestum HL037PA3]